MTNIFVADFDEEAIVDFVNDQEELYDKTNELFKNKDSLWESFARECKLASHSRVYSQD